MRRCELQKALWASFIFCVVAAIASSAQTFTTLVSFDGTDGTAPLATGSLMQGADGMLYGTTVFGGSNNDGTVFRTSLSGKVTTLHTFGGTDGSNPPAGLVQAANGALYGTTQAGGANGLGTVFQITAAGKLSTIYNFCSEANCSDGSYPSAGLVQGTDGDLYGTTLFGGADNDGTVFKITPAGSLTTLHSFDGADGQFPQSGLIQATDGSFYGVAAKGGSYSGTCGGSNGCGAIFGITSTGTMTTLHTFDGPDGSNPNGLVQATGGTFYGTTSLGGTYANGTVFLLTSRGELTTLYSFCPEFGCSDGSYPAGLMQATDGNFYGTTNSGGTGNSGTIFKIAPAGALTTLHSFDGNDGFGPDATLVQDTNGGLYGTTYYGGATDLGTVFGLSVGLHPFIETEPTSGKVGTAVIILGQGLKDATSVTFNGTPASFTASGTYITTKVPSGASTGTVTVVTPMITLRSRVPFRVNR